jgi:hypothetical protein
MYQSREDKLNELISLQKDMGLDTSLAERELERCKRRDYCDYAEREIKLRRIRELERQFHLPSSEDKQNVANCMNRVFNNFSDSEKESLKNSMANTKLSREEFEKATKGLSLL